jgi:hypothetical protein
VISVCTNRSGFSYPLNYARHLVIWRGNSILIISSYPYLLRITNSPRGQLMHVIVGERAGA